MKSGEHTLASERQFEVSRVNHGHSVEERQPDDLKQVAASIGAKREPRNRIQVLVELSPADASAPTGHHHGVAHLQMEDRGDER